MGGSLEKARLQRRGFPFISKSNSDQEASLKRKEHISERFDADFYRKRYSDLRDMTPAQARAHFDSHGRLEGRKPSASARFEESPLAEQLPALFSPGEYKRLNPDVAKASSDDWDVCLHYVRHGRGENRPITELDPDFYWRLYLDGHAFSLNEIGAHFREHEGRPGIHRSLDAMLDFHGIKARAWLKHFSDRAFSLLNFDWLGEMVEGPRALRLFLEEGVQRLAPFSFSTRFDLNFYREIHPLLAASPPVTAYRHWLFTGLENGEPGNGKAWLEAIGLGLSDYPKAFAWREYAAAHLGSPDQQSRWKALEHLVRHPAVQPSSWPLLVEGVEELLVAVGRNRLGHGHYREALACADRGGSLGVVSPDLHLLQADACYRMQLWGDAARHYSEFHAAGRSTLWSVVLGAESAAKAGHVEVASDLLITHKSAYGGERPWLDMVETVVSMKFEADTVTAKALYATDRRSEGDVLLESSVAWMADVWTRALDLPAPLPERKRKVVILANQGLPQCTHYRVEQKRFIVEAAGFDCEVFDWMQTEDFLAALPDAAAAIFYRVPAFPSVVKAILAARSAHVTTYYEVDDLIFDPINYPDPFESFQGQIGWDVYQGLIYGTTLYRSAMRLCDLGIASTTPLALAIEAEVMQRTCFVVRNGLDQRNLGIERPPSIKRKPNDRVRIVYGSATLAHNQDFHDMAGAALRAVMDRHPNVELCIIGHLDLGDAFDAYAERVLRVELLRDPQAYWTLLAECDINLAVLAPGRMADCKSEIKWLEAAILGIPSVLSATATYEEVVEDGVTGLLAATPADWERCLEELVSDTNRRVEIGLKARDQVLRNYSVEAGAQAIRSALVPARTGPLHPTRKRVLLVNVFFPPQSVGGATRVVADNLDHMLSADKFDFAVATTDYDARPAYRRRHDSFRGVPVYRIAPPFEDDLDWKVSDDKMADWFEDVLTHFEPDLVHFHCVQRLTASIIEAARAREIPYFVSVHDGWWLSDYQFLFDERGQVRRPGDELTHGPRPPLALTDTLQRLGRLRQTLDGARRVLAPSQSFAEIYRDAGFNRTEALSNGVSQIPVLPHVPSPTGRVRLAHIGDTSPHKGFDLVESVLRQGDYENLELLALSHGRAAHEFSEEVWGRTAVRLGGRVPQQEIPVLYANIDVLLAPSACLESYGLVTREANAAGVWVIASDRGAIGEDVRAGVDGFVIDVSSPRSLAAVLSKINADPDRFLQPAPRNDAVGSARLQAERLLELYQEELSADTASAETRVVKSA